MTDELPQDPFNDLDSIEASAFVAKRYGLNTLRKSLEADLANPDPPFGLREYLSIDAAALRRMRLPKVAAVIEEYAPKFDSALDPKFFREEESSDFNWWLRYQQKLIRAYAERIKRQAQGIGRGGVKARESVRAD